MSKPLLRIVSSSRAYSIWLCGTEPRATEGVKKRRDYSEFAENNMGKRSRPVSEPYGRWTGL